MRYLISEEKIFPELFQQHSLTDTFFTNYHPNHPGNFQFLYFDSNKNLMGGPDQVKKLDC